MHERPLGVQGLKCNWVGRILVPSSASFCRLICYSKAAFQFSSHSSSFLTSGRYQRSVLVTLGLEAVFFGRVLRVFLLSCFSLSCLLSCFSSKSSPATEFLCFVRLFRCLLVGKPKLTLQRFPLLLHFSCMDFCSTALRMYVV